MQESEKRIQTLESDIAAMTKQMSDQEFMQKNADNPKLFKMFDNLKSELVREMEVWEKCIEELESIKAQK